MLKPLEQFICDRCGEVIQNIKEGWVEWVDDRDSHKASGFKIVHHLSHSPNTRPGCYHYSNNPGRADLHLEDFVGQRASIMLLRFLDVGPYHEPQYQGPYVGDMREFVEFARRLTIPYYEEARLFWPEAQSDGMFDGANEVWIYLPETSKEIIRRYGPQSGKKGSK